METLVLISNPGSASRKYALFAGKRRIAHLHFEYEASSIICTLKHGHDTTQIQPNIGNLSEATAQILPLLRQEGVLAEDQVIERIGLRIVAPGSYFLEHRIIDQETEHRLETLEPRAPLHIGATLEELKALREQFAEAEIIGISDSAFHITKPDYAWNYGISLDDADRLDIKRFGYHGLAMASAVSQLEAEHRLPPKLIICHLGSGVSVTAIHDGKSIDTTMGYSPLEGPIMATRSGSVDFVAIRALKDELGLDDAGIETYLNHQSGLLGLAGASDVRELLAREEAGDHHAHLALETYVHSIQKAIGQTTAALGGLDMLAFTGTVGERSAPIRDRIAHHLHYLDLYIDKHANVQCTQPTEPTRINRLTHSKPIFVIPIDESTEMAKAATIKL